MTRPTTQTTGAASPKRIEVTGPDPEVMIERRLKMLENRIRKLEQFQFENGPDR